MTPDVQVWISTARNGISYHSIRPDGRKTECGRVLTRLRTEAGGQVWTEMFGHVLPLAEVQDRFGSKPCRQCTGDMERVAPRVRPSRDAPWA